MELSSSLIICTLFILLVMSTVWILADDLNYDLVRTTRGKMPNLQKRMISQVSFSPKNTMHVYPLQDRETH